jgi:hypothetical protein
MKMAENKDYLDMMLQSITLAQGALSEQSVQGFYSVSDPSSVALHRTLSYRSYEEFNETLSTYIDNYALKQWYDLGEGLPELAPRYEKKQQKMYMTLIRLVAKNYRERELSFAVEEKERVRGHVIQLWNRILHLPNIEIGQIIKIYQNLGFATESFLGKGSKLGAGLSYNDLYKGARTVWFMISFQMVLGLPVSFTSSIYGYNMLYPLTDNYIDCPTRSFEQKTAFSNAFRQRLMGHRPTISNPHEQHVYAMVDEIENQWDRTNFPHIYYALLGIHDAQTMSIKQLHISRDSTMIDDDSSFRRDNQMTEILKISALKGAASVIAAGYLVNGHLKGYHLAYLSHLGLALQLLDDLQDVHEDLAAESASIFTKAIRNQCKLDDLTARLLKFIHSSLLRTPFPDEETSSLTWYVRVSTVQLSCLLILEAASKLSHFYSKGFYRKLKKMSPIPIRNLREAKLEYHLFQLVLAQKFS